MTTLNNTYNKLTFVIGSSTPLALEIQKKDHNTLFLGRSNPYGLKNWHEIDGLDTVEKINTVIEIFKKILVNNLAVEYNLVFLQGISSKNWEESINVNQLSVGMISEVFCDQLKTLDKKGTVTMVGSASAYLGGKLTYSSTKASLNGLMTAMNKNYSPLIRANIVLPGVFYGGMIEDWDKDKIKLVESKTLTKKIGSAEEISEAILFCIDNQYVCNSVINMTAGQVVSF